MHSLLGVKDASSGKSGAPARRSRALVFCGFGALAVVAAVAAAVALPTRARSSTPAQTTQTLPNLRIAAAQKIPVHEAAAEDPDAKRFTGIVGPDLTKSLRSAGVPDAQGREYVAILERAIHIQDGLSVDDKFDLVIEKLPDGKFGRLLYIGLDRVARADVELLKWTDGKQVIWVNGDGVGGENRSGMRMPVAGHVTSSFGERFHPILGYKRMHAGVDLGAAYGSPIHAAADGRVVSAGWHGGYGQLVAIVHSGGIETLYGHMSRIAASPGDMVRAGEVIGYVGSTGLSTGPHLHFEVLKGGRPVNPLSVKLASGPAQLQGEKLHQFQGALRKLLLVSPTQG